MADYTVDQLFTKLERADAAGDTEAAKVIADEIRRVQGAPKADFSGVTATVTHTLKPKGNAITRGLGEVGGRQVLQGAYGIYGALGGDALDHYVLGPLDRAIGTEGTRFQLGTGGRGYRQAASDYADSLGMRKPQTATERVISDVGEGLTGTALTMGIGGLLNAGRSAAASPTVSSRIGNFLTAQPTLQAVSTATGAGASGIARESGAGQGAQLAAGLIGGLAPGVGSYATGATMRGLVRGASGEKMKGNIADFASLGATPSVGQAAGGWTRGLEGLLSKGPTSGGVFGRFAERQSDDIARNLQAKAESLSPGAGSENAGLAIERGMQSFKNDTKAVKKALYWAVDQHIPGASATPMANTRRALTQLTTPDPAAPATTGAMVQPRIAQLRQNLEADLQANGGRLTYDALKRIRSDVGEAINGSSPLNPSSDLRELNQLYGALSDDMMAAAQAAGPAAVKAATRANKYTRDVANRMELVQRVLDKNGGPEKVFQAAMAGTNDGATTLRAVMYSLPKEQQQAVSAAVIKRMGLPTPGQAGLNSAEEFSANTFLTNWNKLSPESKTVLLGRYGPGFKASMERLASVASNIKSGSKVYANPSGSAEKGAAYAYWTGLLAALGSGRFKTAAGIAGAGIATNVAARALTNPDVVKRLATMTVLPKGSIPGAVNAMRAAGERDGDADMIDTADALEQAVKEQENGG